MSAQGRTFHRSAGSSGADRPDGHGPRDAARPGAPRRPRPFGLAGLAVPAVTALAATLGAAAFRPTGQPGDAYERAFTGETMRVDYFHTGGPAGEIVALDRVLNDGPWPGSRTTLVDETNLGQYSFEVRDRATNRILYSRGFSSLYGEWATTPEARRVARTFHESLRFPWPRAPVQVVLKARGGDGAFREIWSTTIDPDSRFVNRAPPPAGPGRVSALAEHGPAAEKVDLLLIGDGYAAPEADKFRRDARRLIDALFALEPFQSRRTDFNVRILEWPAPTSGVHRPQSGIHRRSPIGTEYNVFDTERYLLALDNRALRDVAAAAPYDFLVILVNDAYYGGGGIFNAQATVAVDSAFAPYVFVHEFAHHFAGLADEYYTSDVAYETGGLKPEPWEPNVTALGDPARLKWGDLVEPGTPIPTPWDKETFERHSRDIQARRRTLRAQNAPESALEALFREQQAWETMFLRSMPYAGKVGAFEGAMYEPRGLYRPEVDCVMFTRNDVGFCRVCRRAIARIIALYSR